MNILDPKEAVDAVNECSKHVSVYFTAFLAFTAYMVLTIASTTDYMLLVGRDLNLPIVNISLPLKWFYAVMPPIFLGLHLNLLLHVGCLRDQIDVFESMGEPAERTLRRKLLWPFALTYAFFPETLIWYRVVELLTVRIMPVVALLFIQLRFLPYHDTTITSLHRICVLVDFAIVLIFYRMVNRTRISRYLKVLQASATLYVSVFLFVVPGDLLDSLPFSAAWLESNVWPGVPLQTHPIHRNLLLMDQNIGKDDVIRNISTMPPEERMGPLDPFKIPSTSFSGRDLRGARFISCTFVRPQFFSADLAGARFLMCDLLGGSFEMARLADAHLVGCSLRSTNFRGADFEGAVVEKSDCSSAVFTYADLSSASLRDVLLRKARLGLAKFESRGHILILRDTEWSSADFFLRGGTKDLDAIQWLVKHYPADG
ncbi:MAG: pentapeptide repeat-containing protein [Armatimonadetes bacterium]|nr:pentapeptide repeat-containing protein [Armatimonadota bacterium]